MAAYLQMGHDSENLILENGPGGFSGIILSPVNRTKTVLAINVAKFRENGRYDIILDPQLYCPRSDRGALTKHDYFPKDIDTADLSSDRFWRKTVAKLVTEAEDLHVDAVCSPVALPQQYTPEYFVHCRNNFDFLAYALDGSGIRPVMTLCLHLNGLASPNEALQIASIMTASNPQHAYIVIEADVAPRLELTNPQNLCSLMVLISALQNSGCATLVSHCSSDMILMKAAGASHCASGKFFNLRRFTRGRFDSDQDTGGRLLAYWFEHNLLAFLREPDLALLQRDGFGSFIGGAASDNPFAQEIRLQLQNEPGTAWVALSWRQYLAWFAATETRLSQPDALSIVRDWLKQADTRWGQLEKNEILLEERRNDGQWVRNWRQAIRDFQRPIS